MGGDVFDGESRVGVEKVQCRGDVFDSESEIGESKVSEEMVAVVLMLKVLLIVVVWLVSIPYYGGGEICVKKKNIRSKKHQ